MIEERRKPRIFHIEDGESFAGLIPLVLGGEFEVIQAASAAEARSLLNGGLHDIDLVVSDNNLGDGQGQEIIELMRTMGFAQPVIGLASGDTSWADASFSKNAFDTNGFKATVRQLLAGSESE